MLPAVRISGCNFHCAQASNRKKTDLDCNDFTRDKLMRKSIHFEFWFGMVKLLALLPVQLDHLDREKLQENHPIIPTAADKKSATIHEIFY